MRENIQHRRSILKGQSQLKINPWKGIKEKDAIHVQIKTWNNFKRVPSEYHVLN